MMTRKEEALPSSPKEGGDCEDVALPAEVMSIVMEYLPYDTVLACAATCRSFLYDAMPMLETLHIDRGTQMDLRIASRFRDIRRIHVNSLMTETLEDDGDKTIMVDFETSVRLVPFLTKFGDLERVTFGGVSEDGFVLDNFYPVDAYILSEGGVDESDDEDEGDGADKRGRDRLLTLLDQLSAAFRVGALPQKLLVSGLFCPHSFRRRYCTVASSCETCMRACRSFPLESVANFENRGSSKDHQERGWDVDVCLSRSQIEFIVEARPGGSELLRSKKRFLRLLARGKRYRIMSDDGENALKIVKYTACEIAEMKRVVQHSQLDVKKLADHEVATAIISSFSDRFNSTLKNCCYLSEDSLRLLKDELGLNVPNVGISTPPGDMLETIPQIARALSSSLSSETTCDYEFNDIDVDCLRLLRQFLEVKSDHAVIQRVIDSGLVPTLATWARKEYRRRNVVQEIIAVLCSIFMLATEEQRMTILQVERLVDSFSYCYNDLDEEGIERAVSALVQMVAYENTQVKAGEKGSVASWSVRLLKKYGGNDSMIANCLHLLVAATACHTNAAISEGILGPLSKLIGSPEHEDKLADCSILLRRIFEVDNPPRQEAIRKGIIPKIGAVMMTLEKDSAVQVNLAHVIMSISCGTTNQTAAVAPILVSLIDSSSEVIAKDALVRIGDVARTNAGCCEEMIEGGILERLILLLRDSREACMVSIAANTLAQCCKGRHFDLATAKIAVPILAQHLQTDDDVAAKNFCWALCSVLGAFKKEAANSQSIHPLITTTEFVQQLLKLVSSSSIDVAEPAMKCIDSMVGLGDLCIISIANNNGLEAIKGLLCSSHGSMEKVHNVACGCICSMIAGGNAQLVQDAIDTNFMPCLVSMMTNGLYRIKHNGVCIAYQMVEGATDESIACMANHPGFIHHLCSMLTVDRSTSTLAPLALLTLQNMLKVAAKRGEADDTCKVIEKILQEIKEENDKVLSEHKRIDLLEKKKAWLLCDEQQSYITSLDQSVDLLQEQSVQIHQQLQSLDNKIAPKRSLKQVYNALHEKQTEMKFIVDNQLKELLRDRANARAKLVTFRNVAEASAPKELWQERLNDNDLPSNRRGVYKSIDASTDILRGIELTRLSTQRKADIDTVKSGFEKLFGQEQQENEEGTDGVEVATEEVSADDGAPKKRTRADMEDVADDGDNNEEDDEESSEKESECTPKKKVQAGLAKFFSSKK